MDAIKLIIHGIEKKQIIVDELVVLFCYMEPEKTPLMFENLTTVSI